MGRAPDVRWRSATRSAATAPGVATVRRPEAPARAAAGGRARRSHGRPGPRSRPGRALQLGRPCARPAVCPPDRDPARRARWWSRVRRRRRPPGAGSCRRSRASPPSSPGCRPWPRSVTAICTETRQVVPYDNARVHVLAEDGETLEAVAFSHHSPEYAGETADTLRLRVGEGITGWVVATGAGRSSCPMPPGIRARCRCPARRSSRSDAAGAAALRGHGPGCHRAVARGHGRLLARMTCDWSRCSPTRRPSPSRMPGRWPVGTGSCRSSRRSWRSAAPARPSTTRQAWRASWRTSWCAPRAPTRASCRAGTRRARRSRCSAGRAASTAGRPGSAATWPGSR